MVSLGLPGEPAQAPRGLLDEFWSPWPALRDTSQAGSSLPREKMIQSRSWGEPQATHKCVPDNLVAC